MTTAPRLIKLTYSTIDHFRETRTFKTLKGARAYAAKKMGTSYDLGFSYAVDMFGTGKLEIREGTTFAELLATDRDDDPALATMGYDARETVLGMVAADAKLTAAAVSWDHVDDDIEF